MAACPPEAPGVVARLRPVGSHKETALFLGPKPLGCGGLREARWCVPLYMSCAVLFKGLCRQYGARCLSTCACAGRSSFLRRTCRKTGGWSGAAVLCSAPRVVTCLY